MHIFEREVNGHRYRIAAQSVWDAHKGRSVARQVVLGPVAAPPIADLGATRTVGTRAVGDVGALVWGARTLDGNSLDWRYIKVRRTMIMLEESCRLAA